MMHIYSTYNNYEADEIQSSSSSSLSFENNESHSYNYHNHYQDTSLHNDMNEQHQFQQQAQAQAQPDLTFKDSNWSINKSPQPSFTMSQRDDLYSPVVDTAASTSYSNYDSYEKNNNNSLFPPVHMNTISMQQQEPSSICTTMSWSSNNDAASSISNNISSPTDVSPSPDFCLPSKKQNFYHGNHLMNMFPLPPPPPTHQQYHIPNMNLFGLRPHSTSTTTILTKGERYHPRFKSANARLSPFTEHQHDLYQHLLSNSSSSSPPPHYHPLMEEHTVIKEEDHEYMSDGGMINGPLQMHHGYQSEKDYNSSSNNSPSTDQSKFQFDVMLHASTAVRKKQDEQPVTYLNRGQAYLIDIKTNSQQHQQYPAGTMTSTLSIAFHESSHRQIAENYWKYWISQQEIPKEAKAIGLDTNQTTGIYNIRQISFDRISFDWNGRFGAKVYVRFNCLSTDFSRIKGVKGIPLRCVMETKANYMALPDNSMLFNGTFQKINDNYLYREVCYCKVKLFRDKGAERKNKDDKKQIAKQMEKVIASTNGNPQQHPLWPIISQPHRSTSVLSEIPSSPDILLEDFEDIASSQVLSMMTPLVGMTTGATTVLDDSSNETSIISKRKHITNDKSSKRALIVNGRDKSSGRKKARNMKDSPVTPSTVLTFYVWTRHVHSTPYEICLENLTTHNLKIKLGQVLSIHPARISEILWKRKRPIEQQDVNEVLVLVEDTFITEHIVNGEMMTVDLEIKADGNLRLVLEF